MGEWQYLGAHFFPELLKLFSTNNPCVTVPSSVWLNPAVWQFLGLKLLQNSPQVTYVGGDLDRKMTNEAAFVAHHYLMDDLSLLVSLRTCLVHVEPPNLYILGHISFLKLSSSNTVSGSGTALTVDASLASLPPLPVGVLPGRPASLECFGFRVSTIFVLALPMLG